jgi:hypothetical protein
MRIILAALALVAAATVSDPAAAYIGPGAGISLLGAFWGLVMALGAAVGVVVWYPLRRVLRRRSGSARRPRTAAMAGSAAQAARR